MGIEPVDINSPQLTTRDALWETDEEGTLTIIRHDFQAKKELQESADKPSVIPGYQLKLELSFSTPPIWRIVNLPGSLTLADLHSIIQAAFGWHDTATHRFLVGKIFYSPIKTDNSEQTNHTTGVQLYQLEEGMGFIFSYLYDATDWEVEISVEKKFSNEKDIPEPLVAAAQGASPPVAFEDIHEYQAFLAELGHDSSDRVRLLADYALADTFDPSYCDTEKIDARLSNKSG